MQIGFAELVSMHCGESHYGFEQCFYSRFLEYLTLDRVLDFFSCFNIPSGKFESCGASLFHQKDLIQFIQNNRACTNCVCWNKRYKGDF
ncbi:hypothetical protein EMIT043CA1_50260 [Pseudomonas brassicacearum]